MPGSGFDVVGGAHRRVDALGKVTGKSRFGADLALPGMSWGRVLLARRPHAKILSIDTRAAAALPGVHAVLTADDLPFARVFGVVIRNQPVLAFDRVRHWGDGVAMVAAESPELAEAALALIEVRYEDLPVVSDPEAAMRRDAFVLHPDEPPHVATDHHADPAGAGAEDEPAADAGESDAGPFPDPGPNVFVHHRVRHGDPWAAFRDAAVVIERTFRTQHIEHAYLEPEAVLAEWTPDGGVSVRGSIQNIFSTRKSLAAVLGLDLARVTVEHAVMGGSFGGKDEVMTQMACRAALLSRAAGRPVKIVNRREDSMAESYKRHPYVMHYRAAAAKDGTFLGLSARLVADGGAYASMSPFVTWRSAVQVAGPYQWGAVRGDVYAVYTNNGYTGAMRGFGAPQVNFAVESLVDELAGELGIDPLALRLKNAYRRGSVTPSGQTLDHEVSLRQVLETAAGRARWSERRREIEAENATRPDRRRRGLGLACSYRGVSLGAEGTDAVGAIVSVQSDGSVLVSVGLTDMGQGVQSAMALIAAEALGAEPARIGFFDVHTGRVPDSGPTVASRSTIMGGQAVKKAAEAVRAVLDEVRRGEAGPATTDPPPVAGGGALSFDDAVARAYAQGRPLLGFGWHRGPKTSWDEQTGQGEAYFTYVYGANLAEVEVDTETGRVEVLRVTAVHDVGRAISPAMVRSQVCGGIVMGVGYGLLESFDFKEGRPAQLNLEEYLLPTSLDTPEIDVVLVENPDAAGPYGAKSIGEPATEIAAPAIVNAVAHATGRRVRGLPADLESVLLGRRL